MIGPEILVSREFWGGVMVGALALAGVLGLIGTWASERQDGGSPPAKKDIKPRKPRKRAHKPSGFRESQ